jgi:hypothetical protein
MTTDKLLPKIFYTPTSTLPMKNSLKSVTQPLMIPLDVLFDLQMRHNE